MNEQDKRIIVTVDEDLENIIPVFLKNRQQDISAIHAALEKGDLEDVRIRGHSMKGVGAGYGFEPVTDLGARLERAAKAGDKEEISRAVNELADYMARVEVVYEEIS